MKKCKYCNEDLLDDAAVCKHCGSDLIPGKSSRSLKKKGFGKFIWIGLAIIAINLILIFNIDFGGMLSGFLSFAGVVLLLIGIIGSIQSQIKNKQA
jgi:uncharacterized membrane protein YvbJ